MGLRQKAMSKLADILTERVGKVLHFAYLVYCSDVEELGKDCHPVKTEEEFCSCVLDLLRKEASV